MKDSLLADRRRRSNLVRTMVAPGLAGAFIMGLASAVATAGDGSGTAAAGDTMGTANAGLSAGSPRFSQ